jgi:hypothetical protein
MKKKLITAILLLTVGVMAACGSSEGKGDSKEATEATTETESATEAVMTEEKADIPYAEEQGFTFGKMEPLSLDYLVTIIDGDKNEIKDSKSMYVADKGQADYTFYDVITYPSEKEGYTTAVIPYVCNINPMLHIATNLESNTYRLVNDIKAFDYYSGQYIPIKRISDNSNDGENTNISYGDKSWDVNAYCINEAAYNHGIPEYIMENQLEVTEHDSFSCLVFITYPNDYDGLSFCIEGNAKEYDRDAFNRRSADGYAGFEADDVGKSIMDISALSGITKDDIQFYTMKNPDSISAKTGTSADDVNITPFSERIGLVYSDSIDNVTIPYEFYASAEFSSQLLNENNAEITKDPMECSIGKVETEDMGDGNTRITLPYRLKFKVKAVGEEIYNGWPSFVGFKAFDSKTGVEYPRESEQEYTDDSEWINDTTYSGDMSEDAVITVPTEKIDDVCFSFGDIYGEADEDYVAFTLDTATAHEPKAEKKESAAPQQTVVENNEQDSYGSGMVGLTGSG